MPTHNLATSCTPHYKSYIHAEMDGSSETSIKINYFQDAIVHTHWSDHLKLSHIPWQNILLLSEFHWDESKHLKLQFEINFVLLAQCSTLVGVII